MIPEQDCSTCSTLDPDRLNADCACLSLDRDALLRSLEAETGDPEFCARLAVTHPSLVSNLPLFMRAGDVARMAEIVRAVETIAAMDAYRTAALVSAPTIAHRRPGAIGVLMGYDFHIGPDGPKLIEINTNAGGALINAFVAKAQRACCPAITPIMAPENQGADFEIQIVQSFLSEWRRQRSDRPLTTIAIVDNAPESQYLYPEFLLFQRLFTRHGLTAMITAPDRLGRQGGRLTCDGRVIDLVYNRLTDFYLAEEPHAALRDAYLADEVVLTPHPHAHAVFADKRRLTLLTDPDGLRSWGIAETLVATVVQGIPKTSAVTAERAEEFWASRNRYFFKPVSGYGSKAAYRGDKLTRKVWESIRAGAYVAQEFVSPGARTVVVDGERHKMKVDVRNYTYDGEVQLLAARLYEGQTTNFRTPGGGFAPVFWDRSLVGPTERGQEA